MTEYFADHDDASQPEEAFTSKTQRKKEMHALQEMGKRLIDLKPEQLAKVPISDDLAKAVAEAHRIKKHEAMRRHLQYIGKLMRAEDADAIQRALDLFDTSSKEYNRRFHLVERWRDRLLADDDPTALGELLEHYPQADRQHLNQLIRNAKKEAERGKPPASSRKLFRYLRELAEL